MDILYPSKQTPEHDVGLQLYLDWHFVLTVDSFSKLVFDQPKMMSEGR